MSDTLRTFFERLINEPELREKFAAAKTAQEGYTMAKPYIGGVTFDEFREGLMAIHDRAQNRSELSDTTLSEVSGGSANIFSEVLKILASLGTSI